MTRCWLALIALLLLAPVAQASTVSREGSTITIVGGDEASSITFGGGFYYHVDDAAGATAGSGCEQLSATTVRCGSSSEYQLQLVQASLGAGDDTFTLPSTYVQTVSGGPGNDNLYTGTLDDVVHGDGGNDYVSTGPGADQAFGDAGNDEVRGHNNSDRVSGGPGLDVLHGDGGDDSVAAQGSDQIDSRDGERDQVNCGLGADTLTADDVDVTDELCESVDRASTGPGGDDRAPSLSISAPRRLSIAKATRKPGVRVRVEIDEDCRVEASLTITRRNVRRHGLGTTGWKLDGGKDDLTAGSWNVQLWAKGRKARKLRALARKPGVRTVPARVRVACTDAAGNWRERFATVKLKG